MDGIKIGEYTFIYGRHFSPDKVTSKVKPVITPAPIYDTLFQMQNTISTVHDFCFICEARYPVTEVHLLYAPRRDTGRPLIIKIHKGSENYHADAIAIYNAISSQYRSNFNDFIELFRMWELSGFIFTGFRYGAVVAYFQNEEQFQPQHNADHFVVANIPVGLPVGDMRFYVHVVLRDVKYMRTGGLIVVKPKELLVGILSPYKSYLGDSYGDIDQLKCVGCYTNRTGEVYIFPNVLNITFIGNSNMLID